MKPFNIVKLLTIFVGVSGCFSVLFSAWFAHAGQQLPELIQYRLENALQIQFIHTLALLAVVIWYSIKPSKWLLASGLCFGFGILCFSGSLYVKTFLDFSSIGKITPFGGILLAFAWLLTIFVSSNRLSNTSFTKH